MHYDVAIIGAGPVGLCLARSLADQSLSVALIERQPAKALAEPAFDGREIALTQASMQQLRALGVAAHIAAEDISPLQRARIMNGASEQGLFVDAQMARRQQLGHLVPNQAIRRAAWAAVQDHPHIRLHDGVEVTGTSADHDRGTVQLGNGQRVHADLVIAADSRFSETRRARGIGAHMQDFGKTMLVCRMQHEGEHAHTAWEWFDHGQTLALLPLAEHHASIVLTVPDTEVQALMDMDEADFNADMRRRFADRLGDMRLESTRHAYPLIGTYAHRFIGQRLALAGDTAVGMHPFTAHGFNFGLDSVRRLGDSLRQARARGTDLADPTLLARYQHRHRLGTWPLYQVTRGIVGLYTDERAPARAVREGLLRLSQRVTPFRSALAHLLADDDERSLLRRKGDKARAKLGTLLPRPSVID
jgi:ubiquinone biosynthesis UbiH/UbiF/VisC/COQ6 family hydroxylase